jgi:hypothetical protein
MDHAAAHERLADLALEAEGLQRLRVSGTPEDRDLLDHVDGCAECRAEVANADRLRAALRDALATTPVVRRVDFDPIAPPAALRDAILGAARSERASASARVEPATMSAAPPSAASPMVLAPAPPASARSRWATPRWASGIAAALIVALLGGLGGLVVGQQVGAGDATSMTAVVATVDRVLAAEPHWVVPLRTAAGTPAGSVAWSKQDFAVLTSALTAPASGHVYRCWLEWDGRWAVIGQMDFAGATAYWVGSVGDWATLNIDSGTRFVVTLDPAASPAPGSGPMSPGVLIANLAG